MLDLTESTLWEAILVSLCVRVKGKARLSKLSYGQTRRQRNSTS
uniref:Uncharacterized protein n=1 Tax=Anguilla anguilla TaxID=7936 RepID=A0A0E9W6H2_ANGAN